MSTEFPTIGALQKALCEHRMKAEKLTDRCYERIEKSAHLNAFITEPSEAISSPTEDLKQPLAGIPVAIKDNICTADVRTTAGSDLLREFRPPYDATAVHRLRCAGATVFGKTNLDEFGMGGSTETSCFGPTLHPLDENRTPGGSSGGSAAAVASGMCPAALGSDTGGSVRQPASFCGLVGFKPSWGRVSRHGLIAFASSLDQIGWLTRSVDDAALLYEVIAGPDGRDATCHGEPPPAISTGDEPPDIADLCVGIPSTWLDGCEMAPAVRQGFERCRKHLVDGGARVVDIDLPRAEYALPTYQVIATAEASSNLARFDGVRYGQRAGGETFDALYTHSRTEGFGREVKRRILLGAYTLSEGHYEAYFERACKVRRLLIDDYRRAFDAVDVVLTPTTPSTAFELGTRTDDPLDVYAADVFTVPPSLAGLPALSVPAGTDDEGLPFGLQIAGPTFGEKELFHCARTVETLAREGGGDV